MRTTIDLPRDLHDLARQIAHDSNLSMSTVVERLIRSGLHRGDVTPGRSPRGMPMVSVGRPVTSEDVRALDDE